MERPQQNIKQENRPNAAKQMMKQEIKQASQNAPKQEKAEQKQQIKEPAKPEIKKEKSGKVAKFKCIDAPISWKHSIDILRFLKNKYARQSVEILEKVIRQKVAVPMPTRETGHRKGMTCGRYPEKASKFFIKAIKDLIANASSLGMNTENLIIRGMSSKGSTAVHPGWRRRQFKRTNIYMEAVEK